MKTKKPLRCEPRKTRIFLVEDHPVTREGFAHLINYQPDMQVCGEAGTTAQAQTGIPATRPDLVVVDLSIAGGSGLELIKDIRAILPTLPILVLSMHEESLYAERVLRAGATGYVMKLAPTREVLQALRDVVNGKLYLSESLRSRLAQDYLLGAAKKVRFGTDLLSDRELEVFLEIGHGRSTRQIAHDLHLSVSTVETYRAHIKDKLGVKSALELVRRAVEWTSSRL